MKKAMKFLKTYKGKDADMKIEKKLASMEEADKLVENAHQEYEELKLKQLAVSKTGTQRRARVIIGR